MIHKIRLSTQWVLSTIVGMCLLALFVSVQQTHAIVQIPTPPPHPGSFGLEATKTKPAPTVGATVSTPGNGASYATSPITINGICPTGLLVEAYNNNVMVGSVMCTNGSFSLQVSLFAGANELSTIVYDDLEQAGPVSNLATVTYTDTRFTSFGQLVTLTSAYGRRSAPAGDELSWPLQLAGGTGPYAFSIDWGDGTATELKSQSLAGVVPITHTYKNAGIYQVNVKVSDVNGVSAFLQMIAVGNGKVDALQAAKDAKTTSTPKVLWVPALVAVILLLPTYWAGRQSQLVSLRNKMLKERDSYGQK